MSDWFLAQWDQLNRDLDLRSFIGDLHLGKLVRGLLLLVAILLLARFLRRLVQKLLRPALIDPQVGVLVMRLVYLGTVLVGVILFFTVWLGSPTLVFGSFGLLALAFSLAFQDILKNFLSGIFLLLERPFRIGDEITINGRNGVVEDVQIRTTNLRTPDGEEVLIPNFLVYTGTIINRSRYPARLFTLTAKVPAGVPLDGLTETVQERLRTRDEIAKDPAPRIGLQPNIDGGVTLEVRYWLDYRRHDPLAVQAAVGQQIYEAIQKTSQVPVPPPVSPS